MEICAFNNYSPNKWKYNITTTIGRLNGKCGASNNYLEIEWRYRLATTIGRFNVNSGIKQTLLN